MDSDATCSESPKRTDVGYKRPPREHQFKKGHKPVRKAKTAPAEPTLSEILWKVLQEERPIEVRGKRKWVSNAELITRRAFELADKGNAKMRRLVMKLALAGEPGCDEGSETHELYINGVKQDYCLKT